jgi:hypothetical protein
MILHQDGERVLSAGVGAVTKRVYLATEGQTISRALPTTGLRLGALLF